MGSDAPLEEVIPAFLTTPAKPEEDQLDRAESQLVVDPQEVEESSDRLTTDSENPQPAEEQEVPRLSVEQTAALVNMALSFKKKAQERITRRQLDPETPAFDVSNSVGHHQWGSS